MTDDEIRALVRTAIHQHLGQPPAAGVVERPATPALPAGAIPIPMSFGRYRFERAPDDTTCLIEPAVRCNHCGYCLCHGH